MGMGDRKMKRYTKGLITGILLTASVLPLIAQEDASGLTLEKDGEQVLIPLDEWVAVSSAYDPSNTVRGIYLGMTVDALRIQEKGESFERDIPIDEIGSIFRGKTKSTKEYVWGGIKLGGLVSLGIGGSITVIFLIASGLDLEALPQRFSFRWIMDCCIRYLYSPRWCSIRVYPCKSCRR